MAKRRVVELNAIVFIFTMLFLLPAACAATEVTLLDHYGPNEILSGTINLSIAAKSTDSNFTAVFKGTSKTTEVKTRLIDFLKNASAKDTSINFNCTPSDCNSSYTAPSSSSATSKTITNGYLS